MKTILQERREKLGMSRKVLAERVGLSEWTIKRWEDGRANTPDALLHLLERLINEKETENER